jgi:hypothetical protein
MSDVAKAVEVAAKAAAAAPEPFREITYRTVLEHELRAATAPEVAPERRDAAVVSAPSPSSSSRAQSGAPAVASALGIASGELEYLLEISEEGPRLVVPPSRLDASKTAGTLQIFYLLCAARQALGASDTDMETIRAAVQEHGKYDESNFASTIRGQAGLVVMAGTSRARTYRLTRAGMERARVIAGQLLARVKQTEKD